MIFLHINTILFIYYCAVLHETLFFSSKEKDKITFGKKQSFFPNETVNN